MLSWENWPWGEIATTLEHGLVPGSIANVVDRAVEFVGCMPVVEVGGAATEAATELEAGTVLAGGFRLELGVVDAQPAAEEPAASAAPGTATDATSSVPRMERTADLPDPARGVEPAVAHAPIPARPCRTSRRRWSTSTPTIRWRRVIRTAPTSCPRTGPSPGGSVGRSRVPPQVDNLCDRFTKLGVGGRRGSIDQLAADRRRRLVEHAVGPASSRVPARTPASRTRLRRDGPVVADRAPAR